MAASTTRAKKQQQQGDAMHGTLVFEVHGVARLRTCSPSRSDPTTPPTVQHGSSASRRRSGRGGWWRRTCRPWGRWSWPCTRRGCGPSGPPSSARCRGQRRRRSRALTTVESCRRGRPNGSGTEGDAHRRHPARSGGRSWLI
jgi:hypothetical protein